MLELAFIYPKGMHKAKIISLTTVFITCITLCVLLLLSTDKATAIFVAVLLIGGMGFYISYLIQQQALTFTLSQSHIQHHSHKGGWSIPWQKIDSIEELSIYHHDWTYCLPWVALRLKSYEPMLDSISFRLASQLLIEQRALLLIGVRYAKNSHLKLEDILFDDKSYIASNGRIYRGLLAMLANRMTYTRALLGFDVFIHQNLLDRSVKDFVGITRRYLCEARDSKTT